MKDREMNDESFFCICCSFLFGFRYRQWSVNTEKRSLSKKLDESYSGYGAPFRLLDALQLFERLRIEIAVLINQNIQRDHDPFI